jgi:uncharacterized membrane protein YhaH (DUF805 family)
MRNWYLKVLKPYANFKGRASRKEFWTFALFNTIIGFIGLVFIIGFSISGMHIYGAGLAGGHGHSPDWVLPVFWSSVIGTILFTLYFLYTLIPGLAVLVRRFHDIGKSGWMALLLFILLISNPLPTVLLLYKSDGEINWMLAMLAMVAIPMLIGKIWLLVLLATDSDPQKNQYGENPKEIIEST